MNWNGNVLVTTDDDTPDNRGKNAFGNHSATTF